MPLISWSAHNTPQTESNPPPGAWTKQPRSSEAILDHASNSARTPRCHHFLFHAAGRNNSITEFMVSWHRCRVFFFACSSSEDLFCANGFPKTCAAAAHPLNIPQETVFSVRDCKQSMNPVRKGDSKAAFSPYTSERKNPSSKCWRWS